MFHERNDNKEKELDSLAISFLAELYKLLEILQKILQQTKNTNLKPLLSLQEISSTCRFPLFFHRPT